MNKSHLLFSLVLLSLAASSCLGGEESPVPPSPPAPSGSALRIVTLAPGGPLLESPIHARLEYCRALQEIAAGRWEEASAHALRAAEGDPSQVRAHLLLSLVHLRSLDPKWILSLSDAFHALSGSFRGQSLLLANAVILTLAVLFFVLFTASVAGILRSLPYARHMIRSSIPPGVPRSARNLYPVVLLASLGILFRPWSWPAGLLWITVLGVFLCWKALDRAERRVSVTFIVYLCLIPLLLKIVVHVSLPITPSSTLFALSHSSLAPLGQDRPSALLAKEPDDRDILFTLALLEREKGRLRKSMDMYKEMLRRNYESAAVYNNIGNLLFAEGKKEEAFSAYTRALEINPESASSHYNLGQLYLDAFSFEQARAEFSRASEIDFTLIRALSRLSRNTETHTLLDEALSPSLLWSRFLTGRVGKEGMQWQEAVAEARNLLFPHALLRFIPLIGVVGVAFFYGRSRQNPSYCVRCGKALCRKCRVREEKTDWCRECVGRRQEKAWNRGTLLYHRPVALALGLLLPGGAHIYLGKRVRGFAYLVVAALILLAWAFRGLMLKPLPILQTADIAPLENLVFGWVFVPFYLFVAVNSLMAISRSFRNEPGEERR